MSRSDGYIVQGMSRAAIREQADAVRDSLRLRTAKFPVLDVIEWVLPKLWTDFTLEIFDPEDMEKQFGPDTHGMTYPDQLRMIVRSDVYLDAYNHDPLARFSLAHELGHLLLHGGSGMARRVNMMTPIYANSEWQADTFAGELLVSWRHVAWDDTVSSIARRFRVTHSAAHVMYNVFKEDDLI